MRKIFILFILLISVSAWGQRTMYHVDEDVNFKQALELYNKEKYNTAQKLFLKVYEEHKADKSELLTLTQYYIAHCAVRLFNEDAEYYTFKFVSDNPGSPLVNRAYFNLGGYFYAQKKWNDAIKNYTKTDWRKLSEEEQAAFFFKKGYSYFMKKDYEAAKQAFYEIKDKKTKYTSPALYYNSHIHYKEQNYQTALNGFLLLTDDKTFGPIAPYYIVQIYYKQGKYEEITEFVPGIIDNVTEKRLGEVSRIAAESFFNLEKYDSTISYYERYMEAVNSPAAAAVYQLAYACYMKGEYEKAITNFEKISVFENELGQNASYYLASCYLESGDKPGARKAFASAARGDFDPAIKQDAMFNYALLTYEVGGDPFNDGIKAFEEFINTYPESKRINEARRFLIQAYLGARNYKSALASIERLNVKTDELKEAYQRIAFNRGIELFNNNDFVGSAQMFKKALTYKGYNSQREARAYYWLGESYFRAGENSKAIETYKLFKGAPVAHTVSEYKTIDYSLAYAFYKLSNYAAATEWFRQFASSAEENQKNLKADAELRLGDCYFMQSNYYQAIDFYQRAIDSDVGTKDYALLQKAICQGLAKKELDKITTLRQLILAYPASVYSDNAYYEIALEYMKLQDSQQAIEALSDLYNQFPNSELAGKALVQLGLLYYNADNNKQAIKYYKLAVSDFPGTEEAKDALFGLKNIYIDMGRIEDYSAFVDGLSGHVPRLSVNEKDSLTYVAAEKLYMTANCDEAKQAFGRYIKQYPEGAYLQGAHFYKGDCHYQAKEYTQALEMFGYVLKQPQNMFTEQALLGCGRIATNMEKHDKVIEYYQSLAEISSTPANIKEARLSVMRAHYLLKNYSETKKSAEQLLLLTNLTNENKKEAKFMKARSLQENGRDKLALEAYKELSGEVLSARGAESKFRVAELLYKEGDLEGAEKEILEFSGKSTSHDYWMARSFLLWADVFTDNKNYFQAIETVQSIIDYYEESDDGILDMAKAKKAEIEKQSKEAVGESAQESMEVNIEKE